ncbi:MAG: DUF499 domain-containing protein [Blastocatellia bacterium]|nr:DUF499 domain-containing protein [Blastocatellia bacterium]
MATSNHERIGKTLEVLHKGIFPFFEREMGAKYGEKWQQHAIEALPEDRITAAAKHSGKMEWHDPAAVLTVMWNLWNAVFNRVLGQAERSLVSEIRDIRNRWAHHKPFSLDDTYRALDSMHRLLSAVSAEEAVEKIEQEKQSVLRQRYEEQARKESKKVVEVGIEGQPKSGLKCWREIVTPHPDVASGRYQQAEFAADLNQVYKDEGSDEYRDPKEFFRRTFLTEGLKHLLTDALLRLSGKGGDPVVELQTNFGGGKTHSMLALYHMFSSVNANDLLGIDQILKDAGVEEIPKPKRAVLVGTAFSPAKVRRKPVGTETRTLWGEMAWQLGRSAGYKIVAEADKTGVSPGDDLLVELFQMCGSCLVLIDEWLVFIRQLYGIDGLAAGSFDANISFAQSLTQAARLSKNTLVVASIPASDIEVGGESGKMALERLQNTFSRMESAWRPASAEEGFEIVRRRLFQDLIDPQATIARDGVIKAFMELYKNQPGEFPSNCREVAYERRLKAAYPIHPELFDRLYNDWAALDKFQRTRGVLRLMAAVIHQLWERQDSSLMIMPANIPIDAQSVQSELTRYLEDSWVPVIEKDVDGQNCLPLALDRENSNLGRYSACRRVARTIYIGSAPTQKTSQRGLEDNRIKLGCVQPGEIPATFGDALRRLTDMATHLYVDGSRYWFATQPSVARLAQDRAEQLGEDRVYEEIRKWLKDEANKRGDFMRVHICPSTSADVPDEQETRLVILNPEQFHTAKTESPAKNFAYTLLESRGTSPRQYRNSLIFLAAERQRLTELSDVVRKYLAWQSIVKERDELNLDPFQANQAQTKVKDSEDRIKRLIPEAFCWMLSPEQPDPKGGVSLEETRLQGDEALAVRASKKLKNQDALILQYGATLLRRKLDEIPLWRGNHVTIKQLCDDFAQYIYLPRLRSCEVLIRSIEDGIAMTTWEAETFAYAESWDEQKGRYSGLKVLKRIGLQSATAGLLVKPSVAATQMEKELKITPAHLPAIKEESSYKATPLAKSQAVEAKPKRFYASKEVEATRLGSMSGQIAEAVVQHLESLIDAEVKIKIEIEADVSDGVPENVVRTVLENCKTLKFEIFNFD